MGRRFRERLRAWGTRSLQRAKEKWWVWCAGLLVATLKDRAMGWVNAILDSLFPQFFEWIAAIEWIANAKSGLLILDSYGLGIVGNIFVFTILILVIHAYVDTYFETRSPSFRNPQMPEVPSVENDFREHVEQKHDSPPIHVGRIDVNFQNLDDGHYVQFTLSLMCCTAGLCVERVLTGAIRCKVGESPFVDLETPLVEFPPDLNLRDGESSVILRQHVPRALADCITEALTQPNYSVEFSFQLLTLNASAAGVPPMRVALWDGIVCCPGMMTYRVVELASQTGPARE